MSVIVDDSSLLQRLQVYITQ